MFSGMDSSQFVPKRVSQMFSQM